MPLRVILRRPMAHPHRIVLHVAGTDRPGVTARLAELIHQGNARLVDIGQSVLHGYLMLSAIVDIPPESNALRNILFAVSELGLRLDVSAFQPATTSEPGEGAPGLCVTALGPLGDGRAMAGLTSFLATRGLNIREMRTLSNGALSGLELITELPAALASNGALLALRGEVLGLGRDLAVDVAVQKDDVFRRNKRLVCLDVDSTFVQGELIDELAELAGVKPQVAEITARAMRGELDFKQALSARVKLLEGLPMESARTLTERAVLSPGAAHFVGVLKGLGYRVGLVSGGFDFFVDQLKAAHGLDFAFSNELEVHDGVLTGRVQGTIVDGERKAQLLKDMAKVYGVRLEQTVAVGDGANDMLMLQTAGLGIAYRAKPKLQEVADMSLNHNERLDTLLFLMGFSARDIALMA